jgi:hypothetical protein
MQTSAASEDIPPALPPRRWLDKCTKIEHHLTMQRLTAQERTRLIMEDMHPAATRPPRLRQLSSLLSGTCSSMISGGTQDDYQGMILGPVSFSQESTGPVCIKSRSSWSLSSLLAQPNGPDACGLVMTIHTSPQYRFCSMLKRKILLTHMGYFKF